MSQLIEINLICPNMGHLNLSLLANWLKDKNVKKSSN